MGKKSASKDRGYMTATEWRTEGGGYKDRTEGMPLRRLPFNCCAISFLPFDDPVVHPLPNTLGSPNPEFTTLNPEA
jgi:peptidyl-prolyl cis-trans isomerase-like protein 2